MNPIEKGQVDPANLKLSQKAVQGAGCGMTPEEFEEIIQERKAERKRKAEEKRLKGMRRIAEMKSKDGIDPLAQFPKEIWLMILENVTPADRANMYHLHSVFSDLMEENKIGDILFLLALDHKIPLVESLVRNDGGELNMKMLLELRLVSKAVRESIDKWIENDIVNSMRNSLVTPRFHPIRIDDMTKLNRMLEFWSDGLRGHRPKRFPSRALQIEISPFCSRNLSRPIFLQLFLRSELEEDEDDNDDEARNELFQRDFANFHEKMKTILDEIGHEILYFELHILCLDQLDELGIRFIRIYSELGEYFKSMPNIRWLDIRIAYFDTASLLQPNWIADARAITQNDPFPKIDGLERVHFWGWKEYPLWDAILTANRHLKYHTHREKNSSTREYQVVRFTEPSVLSLSLETLDAPKYCAPLDMPLLRQVSDSNSNWKLRKMSLQMRGQDHTQPINMGDVLRCLEKFPTLENVILDIRNVSIGNGIDFLMLPNLKKLEIMLRPMMKRTEGFHHFFSLQFLLKCGNLESITWNALLNHTRIIHREMDELEGNNVQLDFRGGWGDLSLSNLWDVFPYLRCVQVNLWGMIGDQCKPYIRKYVNRKLVYEENPGLRVD